MTQETTPYERFQERYREGRIPWDDELPPPELMEFVDGSEPGRALDLGCGYGRAAIYMARKGWSVDGVDFVEAAIEEARRRAAAAGVADLTRFHIASAAELNFLSPPYDLIIDVGCMHSFSDDLLLSYQQEVSRLLAPGGTYLLFAHLRGDLKSEDDGPRGLEESKIMTLFSEGLTLEMVTHGVTEVEDQPSWNSGWFWFRQGN